jgi:hypothetical protein
MVTAQNGIINELDEDVHGYLNIGCFLEERDGNAGIRQTQQNPSYGGWFLASRPLYAYAQ